MKRLHAAAICRSLPHLRKYKIGARNIPPPMPTMPAKKPINPPVRTDVGQGVDGVTTLQSGKGFLVIILKPESKRAKPNKPINNVSETANRPPIQAAGIEVIRKGNTLLTER